MKQLPQHLGSHKLSSVLAFCVLALLAAVPALAYEEQVVSGSRGGWISGSVRVDEDVKPTLVPVTHHEEFCGPEPRETGILAKDRRLQDVAVFLDDVPAGKPVPQKPALLDQKGCVFIPRVFPLAAGQNLIVRNSDHVLHNVSAYLGEQTLFNLAMPVQGQELWRKPLKLNGELLKSGTVRFSCGAGHTWMESYAIVREHPYLTVTGETGEFRLEDILPGEYKLVLWHPVLGEHSQSVVIEAGKGVRVDLTLPVP